MEENTPQRTRGRRQRYDHREVEFRWQSRWKESRLYATDLRGAPRPFYNLMMFPYPSAEGLHVGNVYAFTGADIHGRFMAMCGFDVFEPMGFDAFGIHSENFAIQRGIHPKVLTARNVERFRSTQLEKLGARFDWDHAVITTDPAYYRWTQWLFVQLFKAGLAYRSRAPVNWCPSCKTVLADEQVIRGACERCDTPVVRKDLEQWFFRITRYAERLHSDLDTLDWSEVVKTAQRNWIGRSEGARLRFPVREREGAEIEFFTTRPDTVYGATFMVLAPEHTLVERITTPERRRDVAEYAEAARSRSDMERLSEREKTGVFTGAHATNLYTGELIPIWIADYVLAGHGTGAIMAAPAHDERDFEFAKKYGLEIREVISPDGQPHHLDAAYVGEGVMVNSGPFDGTPWDEGKRKVTALAKQRGWGDAAVTYRLRDWLISRQRYWGPPIPIVYCDRCGIVPVPETKLPVLLPDVEDWLPTGTGSSPLATIPEFVNTTCPTCDEPARRETDVSDNFLDSGWYFLRYPSSARDDVAFDAELTRKWLPVDMYVGGAEHSVLHLLYSRFLSMALHDLGFLDFDEPFRRFFAHGIITKDGAKMSKSHGNVVNPDEYIERVGADTLRVYLMFLGPFGEGGDFADRGMVGVRRFLERVWELVRTRRETLRPGEAPLDRRRRLHGTVDRVTRDLAGFRYNTAIAALMSYSNELRAREGLYREELDTYLRLLAPLAPHLTEELWSWIGGPYSVHEQPWPEADATLLEQSVVEIGVQLNGKFAGTITVSPQATQEEALERALADEQVRKALDGRQPGRVIYVPGRILSLVA